MRNQPEAVGRMIRRRKAARERRRDKMEIAISHLKTLEVEREFERSLVRFGVERVFEDRESWEEPIRAWMKTMQRSFALENRRRFSKPTRAMYEAVMDARKEKIRNKTRERERARRGIWNERILRRIRKGPPAHVMSEMTERIAHRDKIARYPSEVGYVAQIKRSLGMKLKHAPRWDPEAGKPRHQGRLKRVEEELSEANAAKRRHQRFSHRKHKSAET